LRIAQVRAVEPIARQAVEILGLVERVVELMHLDHQPGVVFKKGNPTALKKPVMGQPG